jgi:erythromycin esterase-like protein
MQSNMCSHRSIELITSVEGHHQNARLAKNAEAYYRAMFRGRVESWNLRDTHMAETLAALVAHLDRQGGRTKVAIWAHNSHLGDARATERSKRGQLTWGSSSVSVMAMRLC